ncbi:MAG TPA: TIR domain-containing protein [Thermoanaerobaculia bacterium]|nr:TIR domain-containing protein [Thermoanaerobaculia bacterium]
MATIYDVFLSYNTADQLAVEKLARKLVKAGIRPFFDKWDLIPGEPAQESLEKALDESRTCAVFVGSSSLGPWQNEEMRSAMDDWVGDKSFRVIPVLLPGAPDPKERKLPRPLRRPTWVDFRKDLNGREAFRSLIRGIQGNPSSSGDSEETELSYHCMAQPPEEFIQRSEYEMVLEALCPQDGTTRASHAVGITTALRGAGGFGKTALAQAICYDDRVRQHYPDGILWRTMGENLDSESRLSRILGLIGSWTLTQPPGLPDLESAGAYLRELLRNQRVLVVVDDVWSLADVTPFQGLGNGTALLITTRDSQTLPLNSFRIEVDAMASREAVSLLRSELAEEEEKTFRGLAAQLGEWPLLLKLVNRQLRELVKEDGLAISDALKEVKSTLESEGFAAFDQDNPESRHAAASRTILVSVRRVLERERELYFQLAVFPEDAEIPLSILGSYWQLSHSGTRKLCSRLYDLSLLRDFDLKSETIQLHDVIRKILIEQAGEGISSLHARLLDSHRPASGRWTDLAEENRYLWRNLAGHLLEAGRIVELRDLLVDFSFLEAKLKATDINAVISDYATLVGEDLELRLIQSALRLSDHILGRDRRQLASQLLGRLLNWRREAVQRLTDGANSWFREPWLRPRSASLTQAGGALIRVLEGHVDEVNAVAMLDDRRIVSASDDGTLQVWDLESGRSLKTLEGHTDSVTAVAVLTGGRVVSASNDGTLRVWDLESGRSLKTLEGHTVSVTAVAALSGGRVVSASDDETLRVWDLESGHSLKTLEGHTDSVTAVAVLTDGRVVSASDDETLRVWDLESGHSLKTLEGHTDSVTAVAALTGGRVVSASNDGTLRVWDLESGRSLKTLEGHTDSVTAVAALAGGRVVSASRDETLREWNLESGWSLQTLEGHRNWVTAVAALSDGRVVSASRDGALREWDLESGRSLQTLERHTDWVAALGVLSDGLVGSASRDRTLRVWSLESGRSLKILEGHMDWVTAVAALTDGRVVSASNDGTLRVWDLETGRSLQTLEGHTNWVTAVAALTSGRVVSASYDATLRVWDLESGRSLQTLEGHTASVTAVVALSDGRVVSASGDRTLRVWDLESGRSLQTLEGHTNWVAAVAALSDGRVVSASDDRTLRVWDLESGRSLQTLEGHTASVAAVAALSDGRVISASYDATLRVWDLESGNELAVMTLDVPPTAVAASQDGRTVMAGDRSGRVHFFDWVEGPR